MFGTIPLSCCSCERYASTLRRLSTFLLCTQREQLSALALILRFQSMYVHTVGSVGVIKCPLSLTYWVLLYIFTASRLQLGW